MPILTLRISAEEMRQVRSRAKRDGKNVSEFVRAAILRDESAPAGRAKARVIRDPATKSLVLQSPAGTPVLTSEAVRSILAEFP